MTEDCFRQFIGNFLIDLGAGLEARIRIIERLGAVVTTFNANQPTTTLNEIANELYSCIKPHLNNSAIVTGTEIGSLLVYFCVITAITVIIVVIILATLKNYNKIAKSEASGLRGKPLYTTIAIIIGVSLAYVITGALLVRNNFNIISNSIVDSENKIINCVNTAATKLEIFAIQEEQAIDKALCAYFP